jgi:putative transport protein
MDWLSDLLFKETVAHTIFIYCIVIAVGVALGKIRIFGVSFGITFVLFTGIVLGHFGFSANRGVIEFARDFGLILFVFSIGLQVGPGFFSSFKKGGLTFNLLALVIVFLGCLITLMLHLITGMSLPVLIGVMSGAVTNTPGMGAAQQALSQLANGTNPPGTAEIGLGYAVAYPFGVVGTILTMVLLRSFFRVNVQNELILLNQDQHPVDELPEKTSILITNQEVFGKKIRDISAMFSNSLVVSRILHNGELFLPESNTVIHENDIILVVAQKRLIPEIVRRTGIISEMDIASKPGKLISRRIMVTRKEVLGKTLGSLKLRTKFNINITRVYRAGIELVASTNLRLQMGDRLTVVGDEKSMEEVTGELGNSVKRLNEPNIIPIFIGILLGVLLGSIPVHIPGIITPVKLGLAGGPLIVAILLSRYGYRFSLVAYTTLSANLMLREIGIVLFLASIGIMSGEKFIPTLMSGEGLAMLGMGAVITLVPIILTGFYTRYRLKKNYLDICGLLAGSMTDPPALAYANSIVQSEAPAVAYATVYPLVMFLRIFIAQLMIFLFA